MKVKFTFQVLTIGLVQRKCAQFQHPFGGRAAWLRLHTHPLSRMSGHSLTMLPVGSGWSIQTSFAYDSSRIDWGGTVIAAPFGSAKLNSRIACLSFWWWCFQWTSSVFGLGNRIGNTSWRKNQLLQYELKVLAHHGLTLDFGGITKITPTFTEHILTNLTQAKIPGTDGSGFHSS